MTRIPRRSERCPVRKVARYGTATSLPDFDVCKLSFYLKCCIVGCDMDTAVDLRLLDYDNAHRFSGQEQYFMLQQALGEFGLERLLNRAIFLDDQHRLLPSDTSNAFFAIETASSHFNVEPQSPVADDCVQVRKAMLCTTQWINTIYIQSIVSLQQSFLNVPTLMSDLGHQSLHCFHCTGLGGDCTCEAGCPSSFASCCTTLHRGVVCSECVKGNIAGSRYKCTVCSDCNLCELCYQAGEHDQMHSFASIVKPNTLPELLGARACSLTAQEDCFCDTAAIPVAVAVPIEIAILCDDE
jgi:hypothetical protein